MLHRLRLLPAEELACDATCPAAESPQIQFAAPVPERRQQTTAREQARNRRPEPSERACFEPQKVTNRFSAFSDWSGPAPRSCIKGERPCWRPEFMDHSCAVVVNYAHQNSIQVQLGA